MLDRQHNLVSLLHAIKTGLESHEHQAEDQYFKNPETRLDHAEWTVKQALRQAEKALSITKRLGQLMVTLEKKQGCNSGPVSLKPIWERVIQNLQDKWASHRMSVVMRIPDEFPLIACDAGDLEEIFDLLVENSLQAAESEEIPCPKIIVRAEIGFSIQEEPLAFVTVADTGPGVSEKKLGRIFNPFFTTKPEGEGNGLGLYLVKALVAKNGGTISAASFEHCGITFTLQLPLAS
ncbi:MAG: HAMP domain-containing histidine kinase [Candidatus Omnitrophica bacterium]|nr:HAMP domain-containing histidine kinase [Candidatus Omnitrophota bacterium]